jgi:hypothetical protein
MTLPLREKWFLRCDAAMESDDRKRACRGAGVRSRS